MTNSKESVDRSRIVELLLVAVELILVLSMEDLELVKLISVSEHINSDHEAGESGKNDPHEKALIRTYNSSLENQVFALFILKTQI